MRPRSLFSAASRLLGFVLLAACAAGPARSATYYLAPTGSDTAIGSLTAPWKTLAKAISKVTAGDTVLLKDGDYAAGLKITDAGTATAPITFKAVNPGRAVLRGDLTTVGDGLTVYNTAWVILDGLDFFKWKRSGVTITDSRHITVRNCVARFPGYWGILTGYTDDLVIENNTCYGSKNQHGIYVSNSGDRPIVRFNTTYGNVKSGIQLNGDGSMRKLALGTRGDGIIDGAVVTHNVIYDNGPNAAAINLMSIRNSLIANNLIYNNTAGGIAMSDDQDGLTYGCKNNRIVHNTIYFRPNEGRWCLSFVGGSTGNEVCNNVLWGGGKGSYSLDGTSSFTSDYNIVREVGSVGMATANGKFYSLSAWRSFSGGDAHSTAANPQFVNPTVAPYDFRVETTSPAIDKGIAVADVKDDLVGVARSYGAAPDRGAYEHPGEGGGGDGDGGGGGGETGAPTGLTVTLDSKLRAVLTWDAVSSTATYSVKKAEAVDGPYSRLTSGTLKTTYTTGSLTRGRTYWFVVSATVNGVESPDSAPVSIYVP